MAIRYELPTAADFDKLSGDREVAVSVYVETSPTHFDGDHARVTFKSACDDALNQLEAAGVDRAVRMQIDKLRDEIAESKGEPWTKLSRSLAVFLAPGFSEVFVLPSRLETHFDAGTSFSLGQLWRSVTQVQEAFAVTLSANEWKLWHATPTERAVEVPVSGEYPKNAESATNRGSAGRHEDGYEGDAYALYAKRVADAARTTLAGLDADGKVPLFVFAEEQLATRYEQLKDGRPMVVIHGAADRLSAAEIDDAIRTHLGQWNLDRVTHDLAELQNIDQSLVEHDLAAIAHLAATGSVDTFWFDFTADVFGSLDSKTGELRYGEDDSAAFTPGVNELYGQVALLVANHGGKVFAVRGSDLGADWGGPVVAKLRYATS